MTNLTLSPAAQIQALLTAHLTGVDGWVMRHVGAGVDTYDIPFTQAFTVTPAEVLAHVQAQGWDPRIVKPLTAAPAQSAPGDVLFYVGPSAEGGWQAWRPLERERNAEPYAITPFDSEAAMQAWVVAQLFAVQRRFWG